MRNRLAAIAVGFTVLLVAWVVFHDHLHPDGTIDGILLVVRPVLNALLATTRAKHEHALPT